MKTHFKKPFILMASSLFLLCGCIGDIPTQSYDGRVFDISVNQDNSLTATSTKEGNNYVLTISGSGAALDYDGKNKVPWNPIAKRISKITIEEGITNIGSYYFRAVKLPYIILPSTVSSVGTYSFAHDMVVYTYGSYISSPNDIYYYSETEPTQRGNYWHMVDGEPAVWVVPSLEPVVLLFIGNSFTYRPGTEQMPTVPDYVERIAESMGQEVAIDFVVKGSHTLTKFADPSDSEGAKVEQRLTTNQYDYVILQEQSTTPINNYNTFLTAVKKLKKRIDETQEHCTTVLYETWGTPYNVTNEPTKYGTTVGEMESMLRDAYRSAGSEADCNVHYVGKAFTYAYETLGYNLYDASDNRHQNSFGAYLSAAVHVKSLFGFTMTTCKEYCNLAMSEEQLNECKALLSVADRK